MSIIDDQFGEIIRKSAININGLTELAFRQVLIGRDNDGNFVNVGVNQYGSLLAAEFGLEVARGRFSGVSDGYKFGRNSDIDSNSDPEAVWGGSTTGLYPGFNATSAETLSVVSSSALDTAAGTGARTIRLLGLDGSYSPISEDVTLNGTTPVTTTQSFLRCQRQFVLTAGSTGFNQGTITINQSVTTANVFSQLQPGTNQSTIAADTVPTGVTRVITRLKASIARANGAAGSAEMRFYIREPGGVFRSRISEEVTTSFAYESDFQGGIALPAQADMQWVVQSVSDNNTVATASFEYFDFAD